MISPTPHPHYPRALWTKADASGNGSDCIEVAKLDQHMGVRDSKQPAGDVLEFTPDSFAWFISASTDGIASHGYDPERSCEL